MKKKRQNEAKIAPHFTKLGFGGMPHNANQEVRVKFAHEPSRHRPPFTSRSDGKGQGAGLLPGALADRLLTHAARIKPDQYQQERFLFPQCGIRVTSLRVMDLFRATWQTASPEETIVLGQALGQSLVSGLVIGLVGPLGAGKTQLVKGIAVGNALPDARIVTSPTFTLIQEYPGRWKLFHLDVYRLKGPAELSALGFDELIGGGGVVIVEWADRVEPLLPDDTLWIILRCCGPTSREFEFRATGETARQTLTKLRELRP